MNGCAPPASLAAMLDRRLAEPERAGIALHLADCRACRAALAAELRRREDDAPTAAVPPALRRRVERLGTAPDPARWWPANAWNLAAAAGVAAVVTGATWFAIADGRRAPEDAASTVRQAGGDALLQPVAPAAGATLGGPRVTFRWRPLAGAARYQLFLLDPAGAVVFTGSTTATALEVSTPHAGDPRAALFWFVRATLEDGTAVESEPVKIRWEARAPRPAGGS